MDALAADVEQVARTLGLAVHGGALVDAVRNGLAALRLYEEEQIDADSCARAVDAMAEALDGEHARTLDLFLPPAELRDCAVRLGYVVAILGASAAPEVLVSAVKRAARAEYRLADDLEHKLRDSRRPRLFARLRG